MVRLYHWKDCLLIQPWDETSSQHSGPQASKKNKPSPWLVAFVDVAICGMWPLCYFLTT